MQTWGLDLLCAEIWEAGRVGSCHASKMADKYVFRWQRKDPRMGGRKLGGKSSDQLLQRDYRHRLQIFLTPPPSTQGIAKMWKWKRVPTFGKERVTFFPSFWRYLLLNLCNVNHFLRAEVQRSTEWNGHLNPFGDVKPHEAVRCVTPAAHGRPCPLQGPRPFQHSPAQSSSPWLQACSCVSSAVVY